MMRWASAMLSMCVLFALSGCVCFPAPGSRAHRIGAVALIVEPMSHAGISDSSDRAVRTSVHLISRTARRPIHVCRGELIFELHDEHNRVVASWRITGRMMRRDAVVNALGAGYEIELELPLWATSLQRQGASTLVCGYAPSSGIVIWSGPVGAGVSVGRN